MVCEDWQTADSSGLKDPWEEILGSLAEAAECGARRGGCLAAFTNKVDLAQPFTFHTCAQALVLKSCILVTSFQQIGHNSLMLLAWISDPLQNASPSFSDRAI